MKLCLFKQLLKLGSKPQQKDLEGHLLDLILGWQFWFMGIFLPSYKCDLILRSYLMECKLFCKSFGTIFRLMSSRIILVRSLSQEQNVLVLRDFRYAPLLSAFISNIDVFKISVIKNKFVRIPLGKDCLKYSDLSGSFVNTWIRKSAEAVFFIWSSVENCGERK